MHQKKKIFSFNEKVIAKTEAYIETKYKSFYRKGKEMLEKRWNFCIQLLKETVFIIKVKLKHKHIVCYPADIPAYV